jgi:hypothetical protein
VIVRVLCVALCALLGACKPSNNTKPAASAPKPAPAAQPSEPPPTGPLSAGEVRVSVKDGRVSLESQDAARGLVLEKLARELGFELAGDLDSQTLTLAIDDQPLEAVLPQVLAGDSFRSQWKFDPLSTRHVLAKLEVGEVKGAVHRPRIGESLRDRMRSARDKKPTEQQKAEAAARREERVRSQADALEELRSSSPEMRLDAVANVEPEGPALTGLLDALQNDPDARVRAKIAEQLGDADGCIPATKLLPAAASDPDPTVRCAAYNSLEMNCDDTMLPSLQASCSRETDPKVRECCQSTLEMCE